MQDANDCRCPGARRFKGESEVSPDAKIDGAEWRSNDPEVKCPVHPDGYDPETGSNERRPAPAAPA